MAAPKKINGLLERLRKPKSKKKTYCHYLDVSLYEKFLKIIAANSDTKDVTRLASPTLNALIEDFVSKYE